MTFNSLAEESVQSSKIMICGPVFFPLLSSFIPLLHSFSSFSPPSLSFPSVPSTLPSPLHLPLFPSFFPILSPSLIPSLLSRLLFLSSLSSSPLSPLPFPPSPPVLVSSSRCVLLPLLSVRPPQQAVFLLVDSVDEGCQLGDKEHKSPPGSPRTIAELLASHHEFFPPWLLLICSARRQNKAITKLFTGQRASSAF